VSKYAPLTRYLRDIDKPRVTMDFAEIERVLGFPLPRSAREHRPWWANTGGSHVHALSWNAAGYKTAEVDLQDQRLVFVRLNETAPNVRPAGHPLWGAMKGTVVYAEDVDLTEPLYTDAELDRSVENLARLVGEGRN